MIGTFEQRWNKWNVNNLISWFKYTLAKIKTSNFQFNDESDERKSNENQIRSTKVDEPNWDKIAKNLNSLVFQAEHLLPNMGSGLLKCFGFTNDAICQCLAQQICKLVNNKV